MSGKSHNVGIEEMRRVTALESKTSKFHVLDTSSRRETEMKERQRTCDEMKERQHAIAAKISKGIFDKVEERRRRYHEVEHRIITYTDVQLQGEESDRIEAQKRIDILHSDTRKRILHAKQTARNRRTLARM